MRWWLFDISNDNKVLDAQWQHQANIMDDSGNQDAENLCHKAISAVTGIVLALGPIINTWSYMAVLSGTQHKTWSEELGSPIAW